MNYALLSRYRSELMGFAIIIVVMFHTYVERTDAFYGLHRIGSVGVDIFLLLSGIGLWFSWTKKTLPSLRHDYLPFIYRRLKRIYPTWLLLGSIHYISRFHGHTTADYVDLVLDILFNWGFWTHGELKLWYISAIMVMYLFAPFYMEMIRRWPVWRWSLVLSLMWCFAQQYVTPIHDSVGHIEIFWSRIPIFLIGMNIGEWVKQKRSISSDATPLLIVMLIASAAFCIYLEQVKHGEFPIFFERLLYIPLSISASLLLALLLDKTTTTISNPAIATSHKTRFVSRLRTSLAFLGGISLEIYLLHFQFVMIYIFPHTRHYWPLLLLTLTATIPLAYLLSRLISLIVKR